MLAVPPVGTNYFEKEVAYKSSQEDDQQLVVHKHRETIMDGQHNKSNNCCLNCEYTKHFLWIYKMLTLKVVAAKTTERRKVVDKRRKELKSIRTQLSKMAEDERKRAQELWDMHRNMFKNENETQDVIVVEPESIDEFFEN